MQKRFSSDSKYLQQTYHEQKQKQAMKKVHLLV